MNFDLLETQLAPILADLEAQRQTIVRNNHNRLAISWGIFIGMGIISWTIWHPIPIIVAVFAAIVYYAFGANKGLDEMTTQYKVHVVRTLVEHYFGSSGVYQPLHGHSIDEFLQTRLFNRQPERYRSEDGIIGTVGKTGIVFSEIHAEYKEVQEINGKRETVWHTIFKGILFVADFNKHFKGQTIVKEHSFWSFWDYSNLKLDNADFNKTFSTYTTDNVEAHYLLSPALMERMLQLNDRWGGTLGFSFIDSKLAIAIPQEENFFEVSLERDANTLQKDWQIINDLSNIVNELDLNTRIWTKM